MRFRKLPELIYSRALDKKSFYSPGANFIYFELATKVEPRYPVDLRVICGPRFGSDVNNGFVVLAKFLLLDEILL